VAEAVSTVYTGGALSGLSLGGGGERELETWCSSEEGGGAAAGGVVAVMLGGGRRGWSSVLESPGYPDKTKSNY
jgi:hypothetical protein